MTEHTGRDATALGLRRRGLFAYSIAMLMSSTMVLTATTAGYAQSVDLSKWSPEYVKYQMEILNILCFPFCRQQLRSCRCGHAVYTFAKCRVWLHGHSPAFWVSKNGRLHAHA